MLGLATEHTKAPVLNRLSDRTSKIQFRSVPAVTRLLRAVVAWRLVRRLAGPAIVIALAMVLLHSGPFARHDGRHTVGAVERVVQPLERDLQNALGRALRR